MITIISPKSVYADRTDAQQFLLEWSSSISGQTAYEIYYKFSDAASWSTTGKVNSANTSYDLIQLYTLTGADFTEIVYKVKLYYSTTNNIGALTGTEESDIYTIIFSQPVSCYFNVYTGNEIERFPLFSDIATDEYDKLNVQTEGGKVSTVLVDETSPIASSLKIRVNSENLSLANSYASELSYIQNAHGEFDQSGVSTEYYYYNGLNSSTYYYYTNPSGTYYYLSNPRSTYSYSNKLSSSYTYTYYASQQTKESSSNKEFYSYKEAYTYEYYPVGSYTSGTYYYVVSNGVYYSYKYAATYYKYAYYDRHGTLTYGESPKTYKYGYVSTPTIYNSGTYYYQMDTPLTEGTGYYTVSGSYWKETTYYYYTYYLTSGSGTYYYYNTAYNYYYYYSYPSATYYYYQKNYGGYYYYYTNTLGSYSQNYSYHYVA